MKSLLALFICLLASTTFAGELATYYIHKGKLHSGGKASVEIIEESDVNFSVKMDYEIFKKILVPIPDNALKGDTIVYLPPQFSNEAGYMELEMKKVMEIDKATLKFIRKTKWKNLADAYQILILPKNGKSKIEVTYHPSVAAAGWAKIAITFISPLPILNGYQALIEINQ